MWLIIIFAIIIVALSVFVVNRAIRAHRHQISAGKEDLVESMVGPIAIAFGYDDITAPAKALAAFMRESRINIDIKGGFTGDTVLTPQQVSSLSTLPTREQLIAKMLGGMNSPISGLVNCLSSPIRGLMGVLQAQIQQLEEE